MENYTTKQLTDELLRRGYATQALWCRKDVYDNLDRYNANNDTDYMLDEADVDDILDSCVNNEMIFEQINNDIYEWIASEFYEKLKSEKQ
jgi:hypothetical protein